MTIANVVLQRGETVNQWLILECPFCAKRHYHGAGGLSDDPRTLLGDRSAHCAGFGPSKHYELVELDSDATPAPEATS